MSLFNKARKGAGGGAGGGDEDGEGGGRYANPREFASKIIEGLTPLLDGVGTLEVAGPGFVNLRLTDEYLRRALGIMSRDAMEAGGRLGVPIAK